MKEKITELFSNEEFAKKAFSMSPEELHEVLKNEGVFVSVDEIKEAGQWISDYMKSGDELNETMLENVAGGGRAGDFLAGLLLSPFFIAGGVAVAVLLGGW